MPVWLNTTLLGLGTVFFGLICLIFITQIMSAIIKAAEKKKAVAPTPVAAAAAPGTETIANRGAFVAAVAASIATVMGKDVAGIKIHSIKKVK